MSEWWHVGTARILISSIERFGFCSLLRKLNSSTNYRSVYFAENQIEIVLRHTPPFVALIFVRGTRTEFDRTRERHSDSYHKLYRGKNCDAKFTSCRACIQQRIECAIQHNTQIAPLIHPVSVSLDE